MFKRYITLLLVASMLFLSACTERTQFGECIGVTDEPDPNLNYKIDTWNAVIGIVFIETLVVPVVILNDQFYCPKSRKNKQLREM